jgi:hypothetical protein
VQDNNFYQRLEREEKALYTTMLADKTQVPGSNENVFLSDMFGSPAIANAGFCGGASDDGTGAPVVGNVTYVAGQTGPAQVTKDAFYCCTTLMTNGKIDYYAGTDPDPDCDANGADPPADSTGILRDGLGRPLFSNYKGIFTGTEWTVGLADIPFKRQLPLIESAIVELDNYADPYDTSSTSSPLTTLVPAIPYQPTEGFEIPINSQRSQFVQTGALDFTGVTITMNVDYVPTYDTDGVTVTAGHIVAVETQDFLGEIFPCVASNGDVLRVKMYTSVNDILTWLDGHPGSRDDCNIFVRTSPYNNYADYIVSVANGVLLSVNPGAGGGYGRISDATLFDPTLLTQTQ